MTRVVHFEFTAKNPEKSGTFFKNVFGWDVQKWDGPMDYWMLRTGDPETPGIDGGFGRDTDEGSFPGIVNTIDVDDVDAMVEKVTANGGTIVMPKMAVPGVGWLAYFTDVEGNTWGIMHGDPSAGTD